MYCPVRLLRHFTHTAFCMLQEDHLWGRSQRNQWYINTTSNCYITVYHKHQYINTSFTIQTSTINSNDSLCGGHDGLFTHYCHTLKGRLEARHCGVGLVVKGKSGKKKNTINNCVRCVIYILDSCVSMVHSLQIIDIRLQCMLSSRPVTLRTHFGQPILTFVRADAIKSHKGAI